MVATRGRTFKRPWRRSCLSSKLKSSSAPIGRKDSWCFHAVGSSNAPLLGSTAAEGLPRIGRTSIATRWRSCGLPQSASCSENFVIPPDVFGQTLRNARLPTLPGHPPTLWITGTIRRRPVSVRRGPILGGPANHSARFMRFPPQFLDELRARLPVSEVVGRRVRLKKAGREWKGLSPFNKEKTPSFFVNDQKMAWFDFSSGKNGTIFDFVMMTEGLSFPEAVERLAAQAGMPLPKISPEEEARDERRKTLPEVLDLAAQFFEDALASRAGAKARGYLAD